MRKSEAIRLAAQSEAALDRHYVYASRIKEAADDGCPVAQAAWDAIEAQALPYPYTSIEDCVRSALGLERKETSSIGGGG